MNDVVASSYVHCQQLARRSASSFYYSFLLLPKPKRMAMCALYAFLRRTDDLGDDGCLAAPLGTPRARRSALNDWQQSLVRATQGAFDDPLLPALADTLDTFCIPLEYLHDVIDGVRMDLEHVAYETFEQLEGYCHRVASAVGLACLHIWGCTSDEVLVPARHCGVAFQLTNILRDLREDAACGRFYLPREDFERFGYSHEDLERGVQNERLGELLRYEIDRTEGLYAQAAGIQGCLTYDGQRVFGSMLAVYRALLAEIKRLDTDILTTRVRLSKWRKMRIATRWFLSSAPVARPIEAAAS